MRFSDDLYLKLICKGLSFVKNTPSCSPLVSHLPKAEQLASNLSPTPTYLPHKFLLLWKPT